MSRQHRIKQAVSKRREIQQYLQRKKDNFYSSRIAVNYKFYKPKKLRIKQWVEPGTYLGELIPLGKNKPVGKNITLAEIYNNKPTPEQKKHKKPVI